MSMTKDIATMRISSSLREAEAALDNALMTQAALFGELVSSRRETESDPFVGHEALMRLVKSQQGLLTAGSDLARVHDGLMKVAREVGMIEDCPPNEPMSAKGERLVA